jgi:hypothetical protein
MPAPELLPLNIVRSGCGRSVHDLSVAWARCLRGLGSRSFNGGEEALVKLEVPLIGGVDTSAVL